MSEKPALYGSRKIEEERRVDPMRSSPSIPLLLALLPSAASYAIGGHAACPSAARTTTPLAKAAEFVTQVVKLFTRYGFDHDENQRSKDCTALTEAGSGYEVTAPIMH